MAFKLKAEIFYRGGSRMATVSFNMRREIRTDDDADRFLAALEKSTPFVVKKDDESNLLKKEKESRDFLRKMLSR